MNKQEHNNGTVFACLKIGVSLEFIVNLLKNILVEANFKNNLILCFYLGNILLHLLSVDLFRDIDKSEQ